MDEGTLTQLAIQLARQQNPDGRISEKDVEKLLKLMQKVQRTISKIKKVLRALNKLIKKLKKVIKLIKFNIKVGLIINVPH